MQPYNPYQPPQAMPLPGGPGYAGFAAFRVDGKKLAFPRDVFLPGACVKCGVVNPTPLVRRRKNYVWAPWYGRFFGVIGQLITQRKASVELPLCARCDGRYRSGLRVLWVVVGAFLLGMVLIFAGASADVGVLAIGGVVMFLGGLFASLVVFLAVSIPRRLPLAVMIDDKEVTLTGVHPQAVAFFMATTGGPPR
jgi:hypothetical protein